MSSFRTQHARQEINREPRRRGFPWLTALIVATVFVALFVVPAVLVTLENFKKASRLIQWHQLEAAIDQFQRDHGKMPATTSADVIQRTLCSANPKLESLNFSPANYDHDLGRIDERELLFFWLAGESLAGYGIQPNEYYAFRSEYLTDQDGDGWSEYIDRDGNIFIWTGEAVLCLNPSIGVRTTTKELESQLSGSKFGEE